jgi:hypothetical protein
VEVNVGAGAVTLPGPAQDTSVRAGKLTFLLFALFCFAYALFTQDNVSHNTYCRAVMTANLVQHGRVDINGYESRTEDKAYRAGNYYCDKAPGMSFLAMPAAFVFTRFFAITPETPYNRIWSAFLFLCALSTSALLSAAAGAVLFHYILRQTQNLHAALAASIAFGLGTPVWGWATSFFSHSATAALLVMGFIALDAASRTLGNSRGSSFALLGGIAFGAATAVEYTAFVPSAIIGIAFVLTSTWDRPKDTLRMFAFAAAGALVALIPVLTFHAAAFGSAFTTGYAFTVLYDAHRAGLFGIGTPRLDVLGKLLVSPERGIIRYAPIVVAVAWAVGLMLRRAELRMPAVLTILIAAWYLLMNAGFEYWHGGASTGPRYLTPAAGFSALALGLAWPCFNAWQRKGTLALLSVSVFVNFACTAVDMTASGTFIGEILPRFFSADLAQTLTFKIMERPSLLHFAAPVLVGGILAWLVWRETKRACREIPTS